MKSIQKSLQMLVLSVAMSGTASIPGFAAPTDVETQLMQGTISFGEIARAAEWKSAAGEQREGKPSNWLVSYKGVRFAYCWNLAIYPKDPSRIQTFGGIFFQGYSEFADLLCMMHEASNPQVGPWKF